MISLELIRTYFHLCLFHNIQLPTVPANSGDISLTCSQVQTIEVGMITVLVPPTSFIVGSTITTINIIITIFGRELHLIVIIKGITCVTFQEKNKIIYVISNFSKQKVINFCLISVFVFYLIYLPDNFTF